jgi:putative heme-binding domain-containing protein
MLPRSCIPGVIFALLGSAGPLVAETPPAASSEQARFLRLYWFEPGVEHGNPVTNKRFRVNDPLAALHPEFGKRSETKGNGMLQIKLDDPLAGIRGAELYLELWGGHPGTTNKRVTINGRSTYDIPEIGTAGGQCTHQYPVIRLKRSDLVQAHNVFQFACDRGDSFWGHFIVDNACLRVELPAAHPVLEGAKLSGLAATVEAAPVPGKEEIRLTLAASKEHLGRVAGVDFQGFYDGYDENGDGHTRDWHGMTKNKKAYEQLGSADAAPFAAVWDTTMLPRQENMAVRAVVRFKDRPDLIYVTPSTTGLKTAAQSADVRRFRPKSLPKPFWSRADKRKTCDISLDLDPATIEAAELRIVLWDGGVDKIAAPLTLNGQPLPFKSRGKHDVLSLRFPIDPARLVKGTNVVAVHSDTTHHGIEVLLPGPELFVRRRPSEPSGAASAAGAARLAAPTRADPNALREAAMNRGGKPERGKAVYASAAAKCVVCHKVHGKGGEVGPDLSQVGGKLDRTHLIESILDPSAEIVEDFRTTVITTVAGQVVSGIVKSETAAALTLLDAEGKTRTVALKDIETRMVSKVSLMPQAETMTLGEFVDLIAYLELLRSGRRPTPGEGVTGTINLPPEFTAAVVATGLTGATALEVAPDGRIFVCEQTGALRIIKNGKLLPQPFVKLPVDSTWERGLIGVTVAPDFPQTPHVFVCWVAAKPYPHHVVSRFTAAGDVAAAGSHKILLEGDDQTKLGGNVPAGHQGGALHFGADGKLYVAIGDQTAGKPAQDLHSLLGRLLRIDPDGRIPDDNPFASTTAGKYRAVWALGLRNPFTFAVQPKTGRIFINDVGGKAEEINEGARGGNYGWPAVEHGPTSDPRFRGPIHHYPTACISGGAFAPDDLAWPAEYKGKYFFADFNHGWLKTIDPARPAVAQSFAVGVRRPVDLRFAPDGSLLVLLRDAWVIDKAFKSGTGALLRIRYTGKTAIHPRG